LLPGLPPLLCCCPLSLNRAGVYFPSLCFCLLWPVAPCRSSRVCGVLPSFSTVASHPGVPRQVGGGFFCSSHYTCLSCSPFVLAPFVCWGLPIFWWYTSRGTLYQQTVYPLLHHMCDSQKSFTICVDTALPMSTLSPKLPNVPPKLASLTNFF